MSHEFWSEEQREAIRNDSQLSLIGSEGLDSILSANEREALQSALDGLAHLRWRVMAEHGLTPLGMP